MAICIHGHFQSYRYRCLWAYLFWFYWALMRKVAINVSSAFKLYLFTFTTFHSNSLIFIVCFSNTGWFGLRMSFRQFLLNRLPCLREYGNIAYHNTQTNSTTAETAKSKRKKGDQTKPVVPIISIDLPDWDERLKVARFMELMWEYKPCIGIISHLLVVYADARSTL